MTNWWLDLEKGSLGTKTCWHGFVADFSCKYFGTSTESNYNLRSFVRLCMASNSCPVSLLALDGGPKARLTYSITKSTSQATKIVCTLFVSNGYYDYILRWPRNVFPYTPTLWMSHMTIASALAQQASGNQMCIPGTSVPRLGSDHVYQWADRLHEHPLLYSKLPLPKYEKALKCKPRPLLHHR